MSVNIGTFAAPTHAARHAAGGQDPITPESISALNASKAPEAWVDAFGADRTGATDSTLAVNAAVAWLDANTSNRGVIRFGPGTYQFGGIALGTVAVGGGRNYSIRGAGQFRTVLKPRSTSEVMLTFNGGADNSGDATVLEDFTMMLPASRQDYMTPVLKFVCCRNFRINRVGMDATSSNYSGTFAYFDASYSMTWRDSYWYVRKYAVPLEIDSQTSNPGGGGFDQVDTWVFENILHGGCGPLIVRKGQATEAHQLTLRGYKAAITTWYPNASPIANPSTIATGNDATAGATQLVLTDATNYTAGDSITIGAAETVEHNWITGVSSNTVTLGQPLRYAQAALLPVFRGGAALATGSINMVTVQGGHWENQWAGVLLGSCNIARFDNIYMGSGCGVALMANCRNVHLGSHLCVGTSVNNRPIYAPGSSWSTTKSGWGPFILEGPFQQQSGASLTPSPEPTSGTNVWTTPLRSLKQADYSSPTSNFQDHIHTPSQTTDKIWRLTYGSSITESASILANGQASFSNGVQSGAAGTTGGTFYSGSGAPATGLGAVGDGYWRTDTPSTANQRLYIKTGSSTWTGIV